MRSPIRSPIRSVIRQTLRLVQRLIPTFSGTEYGDLTGNPIVFTGDFGVEVEFAITAGLTHTFVSDGSGNVGNISLLPPNNIFVRLGANIVSYAATINLLDGKIHTAQVSADSVGDTISILIDGTESSGDLSLTYAAATFDFIAIKADTMNNQIRGQLLSVKFTDQSGASDDVTSFVFDSGSTTEQFARGEVAPSGVKVDLINFSDADWDLFTYSQNPRKWTGSSGSPVLEIAE